jgi:hypothetical protein
VSEFIQRTNAIKKGYQPDWLTPSQQTVLEKINELRRVPGTINVVGGIGSGKTFLAWVMANQLSYQYIPSALHITHYDRNYAGAIVDNCHFSRTSHRELLKAIQFEKIPSAVLISRQLIQDYTHYVELSLTPVDQQKVIWNLASVGIITLVEREHSNLWSILNEHL